MFRQFDEIFALPREQKYCGNEFYVKLTKNVLQYFCSLGSAKLLQPLGSKSIAVIDLTEKCRFAMEISF